MPRKGFSLLALGLLSVISLSAIAEPANSLLITSPGRASLTAAAATNVGVLGTDLMQPVYGKPDAFLFADVIADIGTDQTYLVSPGGGYRQVVNNQIIGAYFFGDYQKVSLGENFWALSPGIEWMSPRWDAHLNGYFPTTRDKQMGASVPLETTGDSSQVYFEPGTHNQYDEFVAPYDVIGNGVDAELGYSLETKKDLRSRVYVGGYYYQSPSFYNVDNILGVTGGIEQPFSKHLKLSVFNSYDQLNKYKLGVSLTLTFGGNSSVFSKDITDRLLDPVERHIGIIDTAAGTYDQQSYQSAGQGLVYDDVYFMVPEPTPAPIGVDPTTGNADGTYGKPMYLNQTSLDTIHSQDPNGARIYLQGGTNANYYVNSSTATETNLDGNGDAGLYLYDGQDIYGRSADYTAPASSSEQPDIIVNENSYSAFVVQEGENTFSNLAFTGAGSGTATSGIVVYDATSNDSTVNIIDSNFTEFDIRSLWVMNNTADNAVTINLDNSSFTNTAGNGVEANNNSNSGSLNINAVDSVFNNNLDDGILAINYSDSGAFTINISDSLLNNNANNGIEANNATSGDAVFTINAANSQFNSNFNEFGGGSGITAIQSGDNGAFILNVTGSQFNNNIYGAGIGAINLGANGTFAVNISSSQFNTFQYNYGFAAVNNSSNNMTVSIANSQINTNYTGLYLLNTSSGTLSVTDLMGTTFNDNTIGIDANNSGTGTVNINWTGAKFSDNFSDLNQNNSGSGQINWTPYFY